MNNQLVPHAFKNSVRFFSARRKKKDWDVVSLEIIDNQQHVSISINQTDP